MLPVSAKDYQQLAVIKGLTEDLNFDVEIVPVDTGRAEDGLALSSRNQYLSAAERDEAPRLSRELKAVAESLAQGSLDYAGLERQAADHFDRCGLGGRLCRNPPRRYARSGAGGR